MNNYESNYEIQKQREETVEQWLDDPIEVNDLVRLVSDVCYMKAVRMVNLSNVNERIVLDATKVAEWKRKGELLTRLFNAISKTT